MKSLQLDKIFRPRSVALIGISADGRKLNGAPLEILKKTGFPGTIYLVNPKYDAIGEMCCHASVEDLPEAPDVAMIMLPARDVPAALDACGRKGTRGAVVISSGFEEVGGNDLVEQVERTCAMHGIAMVGPNCEGMWSVRSRTVLTFGSAGRREHLAHAPIAILSQSGAMGGAITRHLQDSGFGCAYFVSVGNETVLSILDYLEYMIDQDDVRVVVLFMEGLKQGERLLAIAERARLRGIVLIALKSGNSSIGRAAAASHTGKIATTFDVYRDVFAQAGIIAVDGLVQLIEAAEVFASLPLPLMRTGANLGVSIFSIPGGTRALTADLCEQCDVPLALFERDSVAALKSRLPAFGYAENPADITGAVLSAPELFNETLSIVAQDANTEALLIQMANHGPHDVVRYRETLHEVVTSTGVPTIVCFLGDSLPGTARCELARNGIICARDPNDAVRYLDWLYRAREIGQRSPRILPALLPVRPLQQAPDWAESMRILGEAGIGVPKWAILSVDASVEEVCASFAFPVALKALPEDAEHKTELGLLHLNLVDVAAVSHAALDLREKLGRSDASLLVQEMVSGGVEAVLSARIDRDFGAVLTIGTGGVLVELIKDVGHVCLPAARQDIERLVRSLRLHQLLQGFRGAARADQDGLVDAALALGIAFLSRGLAELEINPLLVQAEGQGVVALDVLMKPGAAD